MALAIQLQPARGFDAVLFDYDGTLVDSRASDQAAVEEILGRDSQAAAGAELFWATEGQPIAERVALAWPHHFHEYLPLFGQRVPPVIFAGIPQLLGYLRRHHYGLGVVSSRSRESLEQGLEETGLRRFFGPVIGLEDVSQAKPDPEGLQKAMRSLGTGLARTAYIGDRAVDVEAGHNAGVATWRAVWNALPEDRREPRQRLLYRVEDVLTHLEPAPAA